VDNDRFDDLSQSSTYWNLNPAGLRWLKCNAFGFFLNHSLRLHGIDVALRRAVGLETVARVRFYFVVILRVNLKRLKLENSLIMISSLTKSLARKILSCCLFVSKGPSPPPKRH